MTLAIFDLDGTVTEGDIDSLWCQYLHKLGKIDDSFIQERKFYDREYNAGRMSASYFNWILDFYNNLEDESAQILHNFATLFLPKYIRPKALAQATWHKNQGHHLLLITATNTLIASTILQTTVFDSLIGTNCKKLENGKFVLDGVANFREQKIQAFEHWCQTNGFDTNVAWTYSDSWNDLPILELATNPVVVCPDDKLKATAQSKNWQIVDWSLSK